MNYGIERLRQIWADGLEGRAAVVVGISILIIIPVAIVAAVMLL